MTANQSREPYMLLRGVDGPLLHEAVLTLNGYLNHTLRDITRDKVGDLSAALSALPADTAFPRNFWTSSASPLAKFLKARDCVADVLAVTLAKTHAGSDVKIVGAFPGARSVQVGVVDLTVSEEVIKALWAGFVAIVYGESGSGKSTLMVLGGVVLACEGRSAKPFVVYITPQSGDVSADCRRIEAMTGGDTAVRNLAASELLERVLCLLMGNECMTRRKAEPFYALVVLDEFGSFPNFVRAVCALGQDLCVRLAGLLSVAKVGIVVGGTGCERPDLSPGSLPTTYKLIHATTRLWPAIVEATPRLARFHKLMTRDDRTVAAKLALALSSNARAAALLACELTGVSAGIPGEVDMGGNYSVLLGLAAQRAALAYKLKNGMNTLSLEAHRLVVLSAVAVAHFLPCSKELRREHFLASALATRFGIMVDRGAVSKEGRLTLEPKFNGRRFDVSPAQLAVLKLLMNTATRDTSGEGFEKSAADFLVLALMLTKGTPGAIINHDSAVVVGGDADDVSPRKAAWGSQWDFIRKLASLFRNQPPCGTTARYLAHQLDLNSFAQQIAVPLADYNRGNDVVCVNADKAPFADIVVLAHGPLGTMIVLLVQCKRYLSKKLYAAGTLAELRKMGCECSLTSGGDGEEERPMKKRRVEALLTQTGLMQTLAVWSPSSSDGSAIATSVHFVVLVYGDPPEDVTLTGATTHLVHCPAGEFFLVDMQPEPKDEMWAFAATALEC